MIIFEEPDPAVVAALKMVEQIPAVGLPTAHVGIDTGPVILQDGDYFGRTVNTAARIAGRASAGHVLVSDRVAGSAHRRGITFTDVGFVDLEGLFATDPTASSSWQ